MKTTWMIMVALLIAGTTFAQKGVSAAAKNDLKTRFPNATSAKWETGSNGCEAEWKENGLEIAVVYDAKGKFIMTEREMDMSSMPAAVIKGVNKVWPNAIVKEAESQTHANNTVTYQVELVQDGVGREVTMSGNGEVLNDGANGSGEDEKGGEGSDGSDED